MRRICGNPACFNVLHLVWESHQLNMDRRSCLVWVDPSPCEDCGGCNKKKILVCKHGHENGRICILYCAGYDSNEQFESDGLYRPPQVA